MLGALEVMLPDMRLTYDTTTHLVASFPVGFTLFQSPEINACRSCGRLSMMVEPRIRTRNGSWEGFGYFRSQLAFRLAEHSYGDGVFESSPDILFSADTGYLLGTNGSGPGIGVAIGLGNFYSASTHLVARRYFLTNRVDRYDVSIDVEVAVFRGL
jgi:hypothetical protein